MEIIVNLNTWISERLISLKCSDETKAYVISVYSQFKNINYDNDFSKNSIVISYYDALKSGNFELYQRLGDWSLYTMTMHPEHIAHNKETVRMVGKNSYDACFKLLNKEWELFEELSKYIDSIAYRARKLLVVQNDNKFIT